MNRHIIEDGRHAHFMSDLMDLHRNQIHGIMSPMSRRSKISWLLAAIILAGGIGGFCWYWQSAAHADHTSSSETILFLGLDIEYRYLNMAGFALAVIVLGMAVYFWGRGIRKVCMSDLFAGPGILAGLCVALHFVGASLAYIGGFVAGFGFVTLLLVPLEKSANKTFRKNVSAISLLFLIAGFFLSLIL